MNATSEAKQMSGQLQETHSTIGKITRAELVISFALRTGVIFSSVIIFFGILFTWLKPHSLERFSVQTLPALISGQLVSHQDIPLNFSQLYSGLIHLNPTAMIATGLILLILLPTVRVALTAVLFLVERDHIYLVITLIVLSVLLSSLILGKAI